MKIERTVDKSMNTISVKYNDITISEDMSVRELYVCIATLREALDKAIGLVEGLLNDIKCNED